jgi:hypothetical protein
VALLAVGGHASVHGHIEEVARPDTPRPSDLGRESKTSQARGVTACMQVTESHYKNGRPGSMGETECGRIYCGPLYCRSTDTKQSCMHAPKSPDAVVTARTGRTLPRPWGSPGLRNLWGRNCFVLVPELGCVETRCVNSLRTLQARFGFRLVCKKNSGSDKIDEHF